MKSGGNLEQAQIMEAMAPIPSSGNATVRSDVVVLAAYDRGNVSVYPVLCACVSVNLVHCG